MSDQPKLPSVPSALIRLALADLAKVEADPQYVVDMNEWHMPHEDGLCHVGLAGAVMAGSVGIAPHQSFDFWVIGDVMRGQMLALDTFQAGDASIALQLMGLHNDLQDLTGLEDDVRATPYYRDSIVWHRNMNAMADMLEAKGL